MLADCGVGCVCVSRRDRSRRQWGRPRARVRLLFHGCMASTRRGGATSLHSRYEQQVVDAAWCVGAEIVPISLQCSIYTGAYNIGRCVVQDSNSIHQLLFPPANWCPTFASRTTRREELAELCR